MDRDEYVSAVKGIAESIPSVGSDDEESFVVLGTSSLNEDVNESLNDEVLPPIRSNKIHDMQNLIKMEISQINNSPTFPEVPSVADTSHSALPSATNIILSPDSSYEEIQKQVEELIKENEKLKNIIEQNNVSMKAQYARILAWKDDVNNIMKSYKTKFIEAKNYIDKCKEENYKLANDVEKYKNIKELQDEEIMNLKRKEKERQDEISICTSAEQNMIEFDLQATKKKNESLQNEIAEANLKVNKLIEENEKLTTKFITTPSLDSEIEDKNSEIIKLQLEKKVYTEQIVKLKNEMDKMNKALEMEKQQMKFVEGMSSGSLEITIGQLEQQNYSLKEEIAALKNTLSKKETESTLHERNSQLLEQLTNAQKIITAMEDENKNKGKQIEEFRRLVENSPKSDEVFALNEQLTIYKKDFEAEQEAKNTIKHERDQIAEDLQNLQKRNNQLQNEVEILRARMEHPKPDSYICPKCSFSFNSYQSLENHVHRCLDLDHFP